MIFHPSLDWAHFSIFHKCCYCSDHPLLCLVRSLERCCPRFNGSLMNDYFNHSGSGQSFYLDYLPWTAYSTIHALRQDFWAQKACFCDQRCKSPIFGQHWVHLGFSYWAGVHLNASCLFSFVGLQGDSWMMAEASYLGSRVKLQLESWTMVVASYLF